MLIFLFRLNMIRISQTGLECRPKIIAVTPTGHEMISGAIRIIQTTQLNLVPYLCASPTVIIYYKLNIFHN